MLEPPWGEAVLTGTYNICFGSKIRKPCGKIGQGHPRVMIYINFVDLHSLMPHAKFQNHRPPGYEEDI